MTTKSLIGVDVGGTKIFAGRFSETGELLAEATCKTEAEAGRDTVLKNLFAIIGQVIAPDSQAIGIGWAGFVDSEQGIIRHAPNIDGFRDFAIANAVSHQFTLPCALENDARLFSFAEALVGEGKGHSQVLGITLGTGVGSGLILDGTIYRGHIGLAGELGRLFACNDALGEAEEVLAGPALNRQLNAAGIEDQASLFSEWQRGIEPAFGVMDKWIDRLSAFLTNCILSFDPAMIVIGGGLGTKVLPPFLPEMITRVEQHLRRLGYPLATRFAIATLKNAGAVGAALYAGQKHGLSA